MKIIKQTVLAALVVVFAMNFLFAQKTPSFKRFNYGVDASLIIFPVNVFDKNTFVYGLHSNIYYNLNKYFYLHSGIGLENGRYEYFENYDVNGNTESLDYIREYLRFGIPVSIGFQHNLFNDKFNLNTQIGVVYNLNLTYYEYVRVSNVPSLNHELNLQPKLIDPLGWARLALYYSIGIEKHISNNQSIGFSCFLLALHQYQIVRYGWQFEDVSRFQTGIRLTYKFGCNK
ncbi:MAG: hypothetical protein PHW82_01995 [Bacteroidales bacterium]|nr:hypothetical protein [Bacteroidales bacterium]